jgi:hypothetical protein
VTSVAFATLSWTGGLLYGSYIAAIAGFLWLVYVRVISRPRVGVNPQLYDDRGVLIEVAKLGKGKIYVRAIKIVVVKSLLYRALRKCRHGDQASPIPLFTFPEFAGPVTKDAPWVATTTLPESKLLPPRWNPFASFRVRTWTPSELRVEATVSGRKMRKYMRLKRQRGVRAEVAA